jgi:enoyl-CoA hydratase
LSSLVRLEQKDHIAVVTIDNPPLNILSRAVVLELERTFVELLYNDTIRAVIITGEGDKAFSAGGNIKEFLELDQTSGIELARKGQKVLSLLEEMNPPVIAAINGLALGGGCETALACDIRIISNHGRIGLPETSLGIIPGYGGTQRIARLIGTGKAMMMVSTAKSLTAEEAYEIGLVDKVAEEGKALEIAYELACKIVKNAPKAVAASKKAIYGGLEKTLCDGLHLEAELFGELCKTGDKKIGVEAFINKENPIFAGE